MNKKLIVAAAAVVALGAWSTAAMAQRTTEEPKKANKVSGTMVRAYDACAVPNDTTGGGLPLGACAPAVPSDSMCQLEALKGGAKVDLKEKKGELEGSVKIGKLTGCEGEELCLFADARVTTDNCQSGDPEGCTVASAATELGGLLAPNGFGSNICCIVDKGNCKVKIALNDALGADVVTGTSNTSITIGRLSMQRTGGGNVFSMGLLSR